MMRYWIWWNDLIQGPFELDELASLSAFSEDLLVCMEDREDWVPASRVAALSSAVEQLRARSAPPSVPPPPPPNRPAAVTPLQGEFFGDPPGQASLIEPDEGPKGPFAFYPASGEFDLPPATYLEGRATMPFHFMRQPTVSNTAVLDLPRPQPTTIITAPPRVIRESPVRREAPAARETPMVPPVPRPEPQRPIPLNVVESLPVKPEPRVVRDTVPSRAPTFEEFKGETRKPRWLIWAAGVVLALGVLGSGGFWLIDRMSTRSAISEATQIAPPTPAVAPVPQAVPVRMRVVVAAMPAKVIRYTAAKAKRAAAAAKRKTLALAKPAQQEPQRAEIPAPIPPPEPPPPPKVESKPEAIAPAPVAAPAPVVAAEPSPPSTPAASNPWKGKQTDAITLVQNKKLPNSKITIGDQARSMLQQMHEKELVHAAETGERLYLPDKISWTALEEDGSLYRVYLNFMAMQANGERVQSRSYQLVADLKNKTVTADDPGTQQDLLTQPGELTFKHNPMATDIESILGGVDTYNKHKVQLLILKKNKRNRDERAKVESALAAAKAKVTRAVLYFRRTYTEQALQNIAKAYEFSDLLKG